HADPAPDPAATIWRAPAFALSIVVADLGDNRGTGPRNRAETRGSSEHRMTARLVPGMRVRHPGEPDWGVGQVQSVGGMRITVNCEHGGKRLINGAVVTLDAVDDDGRRSPASGA